MKVVNTNKLPTAPITEFKSTQGELKFLSEENYNKLKSRIEERGFYLPVYVWVDEKGDKWLLDGHQRKQVLETEGWFEPIPYLVVPAKSKKEAAERLLEITSQYGTITQEGIDQYIASFELPEMDVLEHTHFDGIFDFTVELPEEEPEEEPEVEPETEDTSIKFVVRYIDDAYRAKCTVNKKSRELGSFTNILELKEAIDEALDNWEQE